SRHGIGTPRPSSGPLTPCHHRASIDQVESKLGGRVAMEAGPRDTAHGTERLTTEQGAPGREPERLDPDRLSPDGPDETQGGVTDDGPEPDEMFAGGDEVEVELRPQRRLRLWQLAPIVGLA